MQPLETEASPRSTCAHCGAPLPPPNGTATFVYGVGAVGYQSCASCGAKWRYLWQEQAPARVKPERNPRLGVMVGAGALVVLLLVGGFALARSQSWSRTDAGATPTTATTPETSPPSSVETEQLTVAMGRYALIDLSMSQARDDYMDWLVDRATATPQYGVNQRTDAYIERVDEDRARLENGEWPDGIASEMDALVSANRHFVENLERVKSGQAGSPAYITMITDDANAVAEAENAVQRRFVDLQSSN